MVSFQSVITAICSLSSCFPQLDLNLYLQDEYLLTANLSLASNQSLTVAIDFTSNAFWVFAAQQENKNETKVLPSGVFTIRNDNQVIFDKNSTSKLLKYAKPLYENDFNVTIKYARTVINLNNDLVGIPQIGVDLSNVSSELSNIIGGSGLFGITPDSYANSISMSTTQGNLLLLYTPTYGKTGGRLATGTRATDVRCDLNFLKYSLVETEAMYKGSGGDYFAFNSSLTQSTMILSTMTSFVYVPDDLFKKIEIATRAVWDTRRFKDGEHKPKFKQHMLVSCNMIKKAPNIRFGSSSAPLLLRGKDYIKQTASGYCILKLRKMPEHKGFWILGYPFLQKYCVKIDFHGKTVSFAKSKT
ncbi:unnamed protein product [Bursaphelenchus okinawaensis]|uniref:Peptidase A1 domain-containing protein n=1 Tax=Bursaphelenchus okinawaensis TaxID=465554 RepID=A0A811K0V0_9BILA|nr:unnamed protein product [Bursaphelenchus okinawaensis]CAG9088356.1 unnamed protein product [Bursaphelenchus okinawaensis]